MDTTILFVTLTFFLVAQCAPMTEEEEARHLLLRSLENLAQQRKNVEVMEKTNAIEVKKLKDDEIAITRDLNSMNAEIDNLKANLELAEQALVAIGKRVLGIDDAKSPEDILEEAERGYINLPIVDRQTEPSTYNNGPALVDGAIQRTINNLKETQQLLGELFARNGPPPYKEK